MKTLVMYPFLRESIPLTYCIQSELKEELKKIKICGIVPESMALAEHDSSFLCNSSNRINVSLFTLETFSEDIGNCVFLELPYENSPSNSSFVKRIIRWLKEKDLVSFHAPKDALEACGAFNKSFIFSLEDFKKTKPSLKNVSLPVIGVCGMFPINDTTIVTAKLKEFISNELRASTVYTCCDNNGWYHNTINVKELGQLRFEERVFFVNAFVNKVIEHESSDILIVEIPYAILGMNPQHLLGCGEYPFIFSQALDFDYIVCCVPVNCAEEFQLRRIDNHLKTKFGMRCISYHVSNQYVFLNRKLYNGRIQYMFSNEDAVRVAIDSIKKSFPDYPIYDFLETRDIVEWRKRI